MIGRVTLLPSARRLMDSLREIGYDLPTSLADIIDNSIAAGARNVDVTFAFEGVDSWIRIADDGAGMTAAVLEEAMRYGTNREYGPRELGRFGLGLKTASLSQCRRLTVASRHGRERRRIEIRRWDLDHVAHTNRWEVLRVDARDVPDEVIEPLLLRPGTVVLWEGLDRILDYRLPGGAHARHGLHLALEEAARHLEMIFHRFLAGEAGIGRVRMSVNGRSLEAWDPYSRTERATRALEQQHIALPPGLVPGRVRVLAFILPSQERFSSAQSHTRAAGPQRWNRQQGFYFYRNDRLIQAGGWNRLRTLDEHTKLARIAVDLPAGSENAFRVNIAKMRLSLPPQLRDAFIVVASGVAAEAAAAYRTGPRSGRQSALARPHGNEDAPRLVESLDGAERDIVRTLIEIIREEFRQEPDILRRFISRLERARLAASSSPTQVGASMDDGLAVVRGGARTSSA